jgi:hypothetical protein
VEDLPDPGCLDGDFDCVCSPTCAHCGWTAVQEPEGTSYGYCYCRVRIGRCLLSDHVYSVTPSSRFCLDAESGGFEDRVIALYSS